MPKFNELGAPQFVVLEKVRATPAAAGHGPRVSDQLGGCISPEYTRTPNHNQRPQNAPAEQGAPACARAQLLDSNQATAHGITVSGRNAPVLALCRALIKAGHDPDTPLEAYRGDVLCLRVRSIGEGAKLTVEDGSDGKPRFAKLRGYAASTGQEGSLLGAHVAQTSAEGQLSARAHNAAPEARPHSKNAPPQPEDGAPNYSPARLHAMDAAFAATMHKALAAGTEKCPVGVDTAPGTKQPVVIRAARTGLRSNFNDNPASDGGWR